MKLKSAFSIKKPSLHYIGQLDLVRRAKAFAAILTWGSLPLDLDFHIWSFKDCKQLEHVFFKDRKSGETGMTLDTDVRSAFGPETLLVDDLADPAKWWLISVHNYSYWKHNKQEDAHMNVGQTKVKLVTGNGESFIEARGDFGGYWWDVMLVHAGNVYILNRYNSSRSGDFNKALSRFELQQLVNEVNAGWNDVRPL